MTSVPTSIIMDVISLSNRPVLSLGALAFNRVSVMGFQPSRCSTCHDYSIASGIDKTTPIAPCRVAEGVRLSHQRASNEVEFQRPELLMALRRNLERTAVLVHRCVHRDANHAACHPGGDILTARR
jgi:hypothetical protein